MPWRRTCGAAAGVGTAAMLAMAALASSPGADVLSSLVDAERAFARMSVATTQREAFLEYFAEDGVWFTPAPANTKDALRKQEPSAQAAGRMLDWDPVTGDVAASADLGYTTGPWISTERMNGTQPGKKLATGWFFSVWRWSADKEWQVMADFGVGAPHARALRSQAFRRAEVRAIAPSGGRGRGAMAEELRAADAGFARAASASGWAAALRVHATDDVRTYRDGHEPSSGRGAAVSIVGPAARPVTWQPSFAAASSAGDLGVTYGAYADGPEPKVVRGYYLHVWKRLPGGWKLAVDVANEAPPPR